MPISRPAEPSTRAEWRRALPLLLPIALMWLLESASMGGGTPAFAMLRYLAVHSAFEVLAIVLAALSFALLWMAPQGSRSSGSVVLAATLAGAAGLDFLHLLSYEGMPALVTPSGVEKGIAFWLGGRSLMTLGLLALAFVPTDSTMPGRRRYAVLALTLTGAVLLGGVVLWLPDRLPHTYVAGQGLTGFKVGAELLLVALLLSSAMRLAWRARSSGSNALAAMAIAALLSALGELCFASYASPSDLLNGLGHIAKIGAYGYLTRAAYLLAVRQPLADVSGLADALSATNSPALICSEQGKIRWVNPAFVQATGYASDMLLGRDIDLLKVDGDEPVWQQMRAAMQAGQSWQGQVQVRRGNGSVYLDERCLTPVRQAQGHLGGFVMLGDDITERTRVARARQADEERLRVLLASAPDAVVVIDAEGCIQLANPAVEQLFGYRAEEILGRNVRVLMPPDIARQHDGHLQRYAHTGVPHIIGTGRDVLAQRKDGRLLHVHLTIGEAKLPDGPVYIGFMRDIGERIRAQSELAEREQRYRALMDTAVDGVWICDREGRLLAVNDAYVNMSGYSRAELLLMRAPDLDADDNTAAVTARIARVIERGHDKFETRHRDKAGRMWPVEVTVSYWSLGDGQFFVFLRDLTQRQAAEQALQQSEERFGLALRGTNDGLWDRNLVDDTLYLSPRWKEMLGYRDEELANRRETLAELLHPNDALAAHLAISDAASGRGAERFEIEMRLRHKLGHWVDVLSRGQLVRDADGRPIRLIGTHQDLSERKRAEAALRESEEKLRYLFELSPLGIALYTLDGKLVEFNEAYRALTGHASEALKQLSYWDLTPTEYMRADAEQVEILMRTGRYGPYDKEIQRADGSRIPVRLNGVKISLGGRAHQWSIIEDLTVSRRVESERQAMQQQQMQSQKLEALGHLSGGIAHDFNNMLAGIMGLASLGLERHISDPDGKLAQYLREIVRTSERGRDLVAKMLAYVRTAEPEQVAARQLAPMLGEMCDMLRSSIPSGIALNCSHDEPLPAVRISAVDVHQIIMNLVINARDAIGAHGQIDIRLGSTELSDATCSNCHERANGHFVLLEVCDDGCGIEPELLPKIFDPFFTTKEVGKGTGLGLSSVIGLVHKAGGHMQVQRRQPRGTLMRVLLPAATVAMDDAAEERKAPALAAAAPVWVVDDDPAVLVFLTELLREHGFSVSSFADPRLALSALQVARQPGGAVQAPVALITDQTMPGLSGAELARAALDIFPTLAVILCTGYSEHIDASSAKAMGVRKFLRKPFDSHDLLTALAETLEPGRP